VPCTIILVAGPTLFAFAFGEPWREAGTYARLLVISQYITFIAWPFTPTLALLEHQGRQLALDVSRLALSVAAIWLASHAHWTARGVVVTYATASLIGYAAILLISSLAIDKRVKKNSALLVKA
jgi:O-antigen/teichoic acid export membrane protein